VVDGVARDFDLGDSTTSGNLTVPPAPAPTAQKLDLVDALRSLATLADRLREEEKDLPTKGNYESNS
jgi:hypothetical protein